MTLNDCKLAGFLGADPELRFMPSGVPVTNLRLGQSYQFTDNKTKQETTKTNWFMIVCYGPVAEIAKRFQKGDNIILDGQLETREWTAQDQSKRRVTEVVARNIGRLERNERPSAQEVDGAEQDDDWPTV